VSCRKPVVKESKNFRVVSRSIVCVCVCVSVVSFLEWWVVGNAARIGLRL
jgi:hypothetical protein